MVALVTRGLLLMQFVAAGVIAIGLVKTGQVRHPLAALMAGIFVIGSLRLLITANNFFLSWRFGSKTPAVHQLSLREDCRLFLKEFRASMASSSITMPFFQFEKREAGMTTMLPVLLVHGYFCNSGYWHGMSDALLHAGITHRAIDLEPVTGSIDDYVPSLYQAIETLCRETSNNNVVIVAHSMGGLAIRAYIREHGLQRIARVVTLGTPHGGTAVAQFGLGANCVQMHRSHDSRGGTPSRWLQDLEASESAQTRGLFVSIYSHHDNIIAPQTSSYLPGATNIELHGIGHVTLAVEPSVQSLVVEAIRKTSHPRRPLTETATYSQPDFLKR